MRWAGIMLDEAPANTIPANTIKDRWLIFVRDVVVTARAAGSTVRAARSMVARRDPAPQVPTAPAVRSRPDQFEQGRSGDFWMMKEPEWFAAILALGFFGFLELLSWETSSWPPCLVVSKYRMSAGQETCASLSEGIAQFVTFLWEHADPNAATAFAVLFIAVFTLMLWRSSERLWGVTNAAADAARRSADALVAAERAQLLSIVEVSNIPHILSELGRSERSESTGAATSEKPVVQYAFKNYGKTPAILKDISHDLRHWKEPPEVLRYAPLSTPPKERAVMAGGSTEPLQCLLVVPLSAEAAASIRAGDSFFWLYGRVLYDDAFGKEREHRFLYRYRTGYGFQPYYHGEHNKNT
jgi:hypothetical protein